MPARRAGEDLCMKPYLWAALAAAAAPAWAQQDIQTVIVTGNPLRSADVTTPSSVLSGTGLVLRRGGSLGETLDGLPGVSSSYFGPNANRPVIRGQDGDRIRVLSNAGAALDASSLSFDHAVPIDPLVVERIEVLRGPAALLYGGSAVGGVVNAIDNRIPKARIDGVSGALEARVGGAAGERAVSAVVETGGNGFALHADAFGRRTDDLRVPAFDRPLDDGSTERRTRVANSASRASGGAVGGSLVWDRGYLGASVDTYRNDYGIVAEDDITIEMRREKLALAGEVRMPDAFITTLRGQAASTDYQHQEIEGDGSVGTTFKTRGSDARVEAVHKALSIGAGRLEGTIGGQVESSRFSALGEEAFVPSTRTRQSAAFLVERWTLGQGGHLSAGMRAERVRVQSDGDAEGAGAQFGPAQVRSFSPGSASLGAVLNLSPQWQLSSHWAYTERAPTSYELYANGVHAATSAYERGDPQQALERGRNLDVALGWKGGDHNFKVSVFDSRFSNYIALQATGEPDFVDDEGGTVPIFAFRGVRARLYGLELEGTWRAWTGVRTVDIDAKLDLVRGSNEDSGEALPRLGRGPARERTDPRAVHGYGNCELDAGQPVGRLHAEHGPARCAAVPEAAERGQRAGIQRKHHRYGANLGAVARTGCDGGAAGDFLSVNRAGRSSKGGLSRLQMRMLTGQVAS
jgi:iron complex outermembrane receptor protein